MNASHDLPIIMLSGMGADERVFTNQLEVFPQMTVPPWIDPLAGESLSAYAKRFAEKLKNDRPCIIGGASFGGFVALEMLEHINAKACILVGSARGPHEFPPQLRTLKIVASSANYIPFEVASLLSKAALASRGNDAESHVDVLLSQVASSDATFMRWACKALLEWEGFTSEHSTVFHIHGENDPVLPAQYTHPDVIVSDAGHALSMSHPDDVTRFIDSIVNQVSS